jgi:hypothetical protein
VSRVLSFVEQCHGEILGRDSAHATGVDEESIESDAVATRTLAGCDERGGLT